ncbi:haloacid dehalogenase superfamily protein [Serratia phage Moabite]|uniref:Haloacid dehalogenase superfamily protein n=1 Tax=Serratia phage Moabite TaxID=2587814 RepID=A0A4Y5TQV5_9CAUD|nr:haloacid dehalogenase superfamily protein [Serratia phage Moabite]QDB71363.1 haloacid dehalogenase superfamily protein [Serratia phage Moabite]
MEQQLAQNIPGYKMFIVWDLDDTVFDTEHALVNWINKKYNANYVWGNRLGRKGVEGERLMDALEDAFFMRDGVFCPGWEKFPEWLRFMEFAYPEVGHLFVTHRGYHKRGMEYTLENFKKHGLVMEGVALDPEVHPDKEAWLKTQTNLPFLLFDDRPHWTNGNGGSDNVILVNRPWNSELQGYRRVESFKDVQKQAVDFIVSHLGY